MTASAIHIKSSILAKAAALAAVSTLVGTVVATTPASARAPRPGARACTTVNGLSVHDGTEITITITYSNGEVAKLHYMCDNGKWVQTRTLSGVTVPGLVGALNDPDLSVHQLAADLRAIDVTSTVKFAGPSRGVLAKTT